VDKSNELSTELSTGKKGEALYNLYMKHSYKLGSARLFGYPSRRGYNDKPSDRGRFLIRTAKQMGKMRKAGI